MSIALYIPPYDDYMISAYCLLEHALLSEKSSVPFKA